MPEEIYGPPVPQVLVKKEEEPGLIRSLLGNYAYGLPFIAGLATTGIAYEPVRHKLLFKELINSPLGHKSVAQLYANPSLRSELAKLERVVNKRALKYSGLAGAILGALTIPLIFK